MGEEVVHRSQANFKCQMQYSQQHFRYNGELRNFCTYWRKTNFFFTASWPKTLFFHIFWCPKKKDKSSYCYKKASVVCTSRGGGSENWIKCIDPLRTSIHKVLLKHRLAYIKHSTQLTILLTDLGYCHGNSFHVVVGNHTFTCPRLQTCPSCLLLIPFASLSFASHPCQQTASASVEGGLCSCAVHSCF